MSLTRNKLYLILFISCAAGFTWLFAGMPAHLSGDESSRVCLFHKVTGIACPSCGTTRSVVSLTQGHFLEAWEINPFGYIISLILLLAPAWVLIDLFRRSGSLHRVYLHTEMLLRKRLVAIPLILLVIINWIWNISKGL